MTDHSNLFTKHPVDRPREQMITIIGGTQDFAPLMKGDSAMPETERLSALIGGVYDAALDPTLWVDVLRETRAFIGGWALALSWKDAVAKRGGSYFDEGNLVPPYRQLYFDRYVKLDPCTTGQFFAEIGEPIATADLIPYEEFLQTRFYKEWVQPQGLVDGAIAVLDKSVTNFSFLALFRHQRDGLFDNEARRRMRLVVPHFRRAALIGKVIDLEKAEAASLADALDGISAGMFLVDATGRIMHANAAGHVMLNAAVVLRANGGLLAMNDPQSHQVLADAFATADNGDEAVDVKGVAVPLVARDGERYVAHVLPLTSGARRRAGASYAAAAALFVHKATLNTPSPPEAIAKAYKLTPMELRVLLAIVEVGGVPEVAEALGIAESTVKTHLGRIYGKTDIGRQADLVKLFAGFSCPLVG
jgi:DNA-binding CsgD family transcriptional regulator/PAS domain-containing protein